MFEAVAIAVDDKTALYRELAQQLSGLLSGERDAIANATNTAALLFSSLPDLNWAGFYFLRSPEVLVLGPFQGKPACVRIAVGRGVCGTAVERRQSMLVEDVHALADHIACDAASRSELVVPLMRGTASWASSTSTAPCSRGSISTISADRNDCSNLREGQR